MMSETTLSLPTGSRKRNAGDASGDSILISRGMAQKVALALALFTSSISLGLAVFVGLQRAGTTTEQVWSVAMAFAAVLSSHLAPILWRIVPSRGRIALLALWLVALSVVLRGQADFLALAHQHAADHRVQNGPVLAVPSVIDVPVGRDLTSITRDIATVSVDIADVEARRCLGDCRGSRARKAALSAQLVALDAEANEVKRREAEEDWLRDQAGRAEELRESQRADPVTSLVARWLGTTEARLNLLLDVACVVVLEGTACFAWYVAGIKPVVTGRTTIASDHQASTPQSEVVVPVADATWTGRVERSTTQVVTVTREEPVTNDATPGSAMPDDDLLLAKIHEAVVAGRLKRNLASIRKFLGCGQARASQLNRLYLARFGKLGGHEIDTWSCDSAV